MATLELLQVYVGQYGKAVKLEGAKDKVTCCGARERSERPVDTSPADIFWRQSSLLK